MGVLKPEVPGESCSGSAPSLECGGEEGMFASRAVIGGGGARAGAVHPPTFSAKSSHNRPVIDKVECAALDVSGDGRADL